MDRKILFLINKPRLGGAERAFVNQINFLNKKGFEVYFGCLFGIFSRENFFSDLEIVPERLKEFNFKSIGDLSGYSAIRRFCREKKIDIIYSTLELANIAARLSKIFRPSLKVIIRESGMANRKSRQYKILDWFLNFLADKIIATSEEVEKSLLAYQRVHAKKFFVLENAVRVNGWEELLEKKKQLEKNEREIRLLNVGWMDDDNKGQKGIIEAIGEIIKEKALAKKIILVLVGKGRLKESLEALAKEKNLGENISFLGRLPFAKVIEQYLLADIYIANSRSEGCSNSLLEAMSFGLPVISTKAGSAGKIIVSGQNGILISIGNKLQLKEAVIKLVRDQELRQQLGHSAWQTIKNNYSPEIQLAKLAKLFNEI